jgi:uncharacterized protein (TIGR02145 family)
LATASSGDLYFSEDIGFTLPITGGAEEEFQVDADGMPGKVYVRAYDNSSVCTIADSPIDSITITVNPMPTVTITITDNDTTICSINLSENVNLTTMVTQSSGTLQFSKNGVTFSPLISNPTAYPMANETTETFFVRAYNSATGCYTPMDGYGEFTVTIDPCGAILRLLDCSVLTNKTEQILSAEDCFYTHDNTDWDAIPLRTPIDSMRYYINGVLHTSPDPSTLNGASFPIGVSQVEVIAYLDTKEASCEFTVTITPKCPEISNPDGDANTYPVTSVATLCWTTNLKATHYTNDEEIEFAKPYYSTQSPDVVENENTYGRLYTWYSAVGVPEGSNEMPIPNNKGYIQGVCPEGYHIPSQEEFNLLIKAYTVEELKSEDLWLVPGNNHSGFDAKPAGKFNGLKNRFEDLRAFTGYWSSEAPTPSTLYANYFYITYFCDALQEEQAPKTDGLSVRCIWDGVCPE